MQEDSKNTPDTDPSGLFSTYKTHPLEGGEPINQIDKDSYTDHTQGGEKKDQENNSIKALRIIIDGCVRMTKIAVWSIAVFGGLFIAALATNTIDRAVSIINASILSKIGTHMTLSGEVSVAKDESKTMTPTGLTSNALDTTTPPVTPDVIANKRRALLEARKAAKLLEEKQKSAEKSIQ